MTEPTLASTLAAAESARAANHAAYGSPRRDVANVYDRAVANVYDRAGALHQLLCRTEQLARMLGEDVARLRGVAELTSTEGGDPGGQALSAAADLAQAAESVNLAAALANSAWSYLSPLYIHEGPS